MKIDVVPGTLTADRAMALLLDEKVCLGCGEPLDFWGLMPRTYHAGYCRYRALNPLTQMVMA